MAITRTTVVAFIAGCAITGGGSALAGKLVTVPFGGAADFRGLDWYCWNVKTGFSDVPDPGPAVSCSRESLIGKQVDGRGVEITRFHIYVTAADGSHPIARYTRAP
jgi:hypothetical protein